MKVMLPKVLQLLKSPRAVMSVLTLAVLAIIIFLSRHELVKAWNLFLHADLWLLFLLLPFQIIVYFAGGEMIFSYLKREESDSSYFQAGADEDCAGA